MAHSYEIDENADYQYLIQNFGRDRIMSRYSWLSDLMGDFIDYKKYSHYVRVSEKILDHVIVDYFVDIDRLKEFQKIQKTHDSKIYSYLSFWILRHKPMQILDDNNEEVTFINEEFVTNFLCSYLFSEPENAALLNNQREVVDNFVATLLYSFKYREFSAKTIELMILGFQAGRGYQYSVDYQK